MAFWSDATLDPKRAFKFKITFNLLSGGGPNGSSAATYLAQSADRPSFTISDTTKVDYLDKSFHFPGKITWNPIKIKFVDTDSSTGGVNVSKATYDYLTTTGWISPSKGPNNFSTLSKNGAVAAGNTSSLKIQVLNSNGVTVDTWSIKNAFITTVSMTPLDYKSEDILTVEYTFRYDWADFTST